MTNWHAVGVTHRHREEAALAIAQQRSEHADAMREAARVRWPRIVSAIRAIVAAYNGGMGGERVAVLEKDDPQSPSVTIESRATTGSSVVITLDEAELRVAIRSMGADLCGSTRWVDLLRGDDDTAAYLLQDWIERP